MYVEGTCSCFNWDTEGTFPFWSISTVRGTGVLVLESVMWAKTGHMYNTSFGDSIRTTSFIMDANRKRCDYVVTSFLF